MSVAMLEQAFDRFVRNIGGETRCSPNRAAVRYIDLEPLNLPSGSVRFCIDTEDAVAIIETTVPLSGLISPDADVLGKLLALQALASPAHSGKRLFPTLDLASERLSMSYLAGADTVRNEDELAAMIDGCVNVVAQLLSEARKALQDNGLSDVMPNSRKTPRPNSAGAWNSLRMKV